MIEIRKFQAGSVALVAAIMAGSVQQLSWKNQDNHMVVVDHEMVGMVYSSSKSVIAKINENKEPRQWLFEHRPQGGEVTALIKL